MNGHSTLVAVEKNEGGTFYPLRIFNAEAAAESFDENSLAASNFSSQSNNGSGPEFFSEALRKLECLRLGVGLEGAA